MWRSTIRAGGILVVLAVFAGDVSRGEESYALDFELESNDVPDLGETLAISGEPGEFVRFRANLILGSAGVGQDGSGVQGWSISVWHAAMDAEALSIDGTVSATESDGGLRVPGEENSFFRFETIEPGRNGGRRGTVQAVVLGLAGHRVELPPNTRQVIGRIHYRVVVGESPRVGFFRYEDGLRGAGQPVANVLTVEGQSVYPTLTSREIRIGGGAEPEESEEACTNGVDDDGDSWADALDPGCAEVLGGEDCTDGVDNDDDGRVDCDDPACSANAACREICGNGRDDDGDDAVDCDDVDCLGAAGCVPIENCRDGVDNDDDGLVDCDDPQCAAFADCRVPEDCGDGVDNDGDGLVDCLDAGCLGVPPCPVPERCADGIDNDEDGFVDCDDPDCVAVTACLARENCGNGRDDDFDGRVDCDDRDCAGIAGCPPREICDNTRDDDGDGRVDCDDPSCFDELPCGGGEGFDLVLWAEGATRVRSPAKGIGVLEWNVVPIAPGAESLEILGLVVPVPRPQTEGVQGWSLAVAHDPARLRFASATIDGTDAESLIQSGFERTEGARTSNREKGAESDGFVSAVVLSFTMPVTLDPSVPQSIVRARYDVLEAGGVQGEALLPGGVGFQDGLRGAGQPVSNLLTVRGATVFPRRQVPIVLGSGSVFRRGDANADGRIDLADAVWVLNELVRGGPGSPCRLAADVNDDSRVDLSDPIWLAHHLFLAGPPPPPPYPGCGVGVRSPAGCAEAFVCR